MSLPSRMSSLIHLHGILEEAHLSVFSKTCTHGSFAKATANCRDEFMSCNMTQLHHHVHLCGIMLHEQLVLILLSKDTLLFELKKFSDDLGAWQPDPNFVLLLLTDRSTSSTYMLGATVNWTFTITCKAFWTRTLVALPLV